MEKPHKIMFSVVAVMLYWLAAGGFSDGTIQRKLVDVNDETVSFYAFVAEELPLGSGFAVTEGAGFWSAGSTTQVLQKQSQLYKAVIGVMQNKVACAVLQYISQLQINPVRIRKSDMLFPFHYFF